MFTLRSLIAVALAAALSLSISLFVATDFSSPFSKLRKIFSSYASRVDIWFTFAQIISRSPAAWDDGFQEVVVFFLYEWYQAREVLDRNYHHPLLRVLGLIRVVHDIKQSTGLYGDDNALKG